MPAAAHEAHAFERICMVSTWSCACVRGCSADGAPAFAVTRRDTSRTLSALTSKNCASFAKPASARAKECLVEIEHSLPFQLFVQLC